MGVGYLRTRWGWRGVSMAIWVLHLSSLAILSCNGSFPTIMVGHYLFGCGYGLSDSGFCAWASKVRHTNAVQGLMHGCFSVGASLGPLVAAALAGRDYAWFVFYRVLVSLYRWPHPIFTKLQILLACIEASINALAFRNDTAVMNDVHLRIRAERALPQSYNPVYMCGIFLFLYNGVEGRPTA